jgi:hypothetical protein
MPLNRVPLTGNQIVAMANVSRQEKTNFTATGTYEYSELNSLGLPSLLYWVRLDTAVANIRFYPLFAVSNITTGTGPAPNWATFNNGTILVPGNVTVFTIRAAVSVIGIRIVIDPGIPVPISVTSILTAGG